MFLVTFVIFLMFLYIAREQLDLEFGEIHRKTPVLESHF